ncbi:co-chaperone HscB [Vibrio rhizosphaerae]|uniref:Co-chaperone protein HscB homolog n=1 Tax=Vibrio rhizosphaerae TaxID=398736 RepID=A0ABU4IS23_9VIBR|nr:co-chaperone HscB [Vibrio rhizosphaerae]MDW6092084.1 co-chaperone HscB [Vibrio rhizosphaerae]
MNYFELFGLPTQFDLDGSLLSSQFRELQKRFHPDNFAAASERERLVAVQKASEINDAYQTLKNEIRRAEYLLMLHDIDLRSEQQTMQDPEFLMEQMLLREELETLESAADAQSQLIDFDGKVSKMYKIQLTTLKEQLAQCQWESAADTARKLKFIAKLRNEIERAEEKLLG